VRKHRTFVTLFLDTLLVVAAIVALVGVFTYYKFNAHYQMEARQNQDRLARVSAEHFQALWPLDQSRVDRICKDLLHDPAMRLTVVAPDGAVLGDSEADPSKMGNHRTNDRPEVLAALAGGNGENRRHSETLGILFRYVALPVMHDGQVAAAVRLAVPVKTIIEGEALIRNTILMSVAVGAAAAVALSLLSSWMWYAPLRRITRTAKQIASGDLSSKADLSGKGRLAELANALNDTRDSLGKHLGQIASQHQDFSAVLSNLSEGVIATDIEGHIVLMNRAAGDLLAVPRARAGAQIASVLRSLEILEFRERSIASGAPRRGQFEIEIPAGRRVLDIHAAKVAPGPSSISGLLVMRDVTELATAGAMKTQFVANASHELRTPLATIRAAVDSLRSAEDKRELAKLADVLDRHVRRLEEMTKDLLDLHMAESAKFPLRLEDISLGDLAEWARAQFNPRAQQKGLTLSVAADRPERNIRSDRKLLELILRNLMDNAIKFTPSGGRVECAFEAAEHGATIRVSDTGCGIKPADQPRVFERFYQGDAARAGDAATRGTGLGLAIVKHATERLGAKVDLRSEAGRGTVVTAFLPRADEGTP
jgi:two-component system, OmpR family, phosphate regulon sensor histidine kinase PhoR